MHSDLKDSLDTPENFFWQYNFKIRILEKCNLYPAWPENQSNVGQRSRSIMADSSDHRDTKSRMYE